MAQVFTQICRSVADLKKQFFISIFLRSMVAVFKQSYPSHSYEYLSGIDPIKPMDCVR